MGFRCPKCHKDFGRDRVSWMAHIVENKVDIVEPIKKRIPKDA